MGNKIDSNKEIYNFLGYKANDQSTYTTDQAKSKGNLGKGARDI